MSLSRTPPSRLRGASPSATIARMRRTPTAASARSTRWVSARSVVLASALALAVVLGVSIAGAQTDDAAIRAATDLVMRQLEAFRRDDFEAAYALASREIRKIFDRAA